MRSPSIPRFGAGFVAACFLASTTLLHADTEIIDGYNASIHEITGPDDLHLDPGNVIVAIAAFGDEDREVNGITFQTDKPDAGVVVNGDVTVTTKANHSIDGWAAKPGFVGGQGDSADNLAQVMRDIRYEGAPNPVNIEIAGLAPGAGYEVQILVNEGANRNRHWDIGVGVDPDIELVVDNFTSEGEAALPDDPGSGGVWSSNNSFAYSAEFTAGGDGILNLVMQREIDGPGGTPFRPGKDNNPILQAVIVHRAGPSVPFQITDITVSAEQVVLSWNSLPGRDYAVEFTTDLSNPTWIEIDDGIASEGATTSFTDDDPARVGVPEGYYRVRR